MSHAAAPRPAPGPRPAGSRLELRGVSQGYLRRGALRTVLDAVDLALEPGAFVALTGASGAGKTTVLELAAGLQRPVAGRVLLDGADLGALDDARLAELRLTRVGMLFQHHDLIPTLNAAENVALPLLLAGAQRHAALARAERLVERLGIAGRGAELPVELSLGERQRLCVARALVNEPRLLLADEPTAGLDSVAADEVMRLLSELVDEAGLTVLLATHDVRAAAYADRAFRLSGGRLEPA